MINFCGKCDGDGRIATPGRRWWRFWDTIVCDLCLGDGYERPTQLKPGDYPGDLGENMKKLESVLRECATKNESVALQQKDMRLKRIEANQVAIIAGLNRIGRFYNLGPGFHYLMGKALPAARDKNLYPAGKGTRLRFAGYQNLSRLVARLL